MKTLENEKNFEEVPEEQLKEVNGGAQAYGSTAEVEPDGMHGCPPLFQPLYYDKEIGMWICINPVAL